MSQVTEKELAEKAVGPRVTYDYLLSQIASEHYFTAADGVDGATLDALRSKNEYLGTTLPAKKYDPPIDGTPLADLALLTFCVLRLKNGFTVHGSSACADPANYNRGIGERLAWQNAVNQIWPLLGYELKTQLANDAYLSSQGADQPQDKAEAQFRLGLTEDAAELLGALSPAQLMKVASGNMLLCRFRVEDDLV